MNTHVLMKIVTPRTSLRQRVLTVAATVALGFAPVARAAIEVGSDGSGTLTFDIAPAATEWSTLSWTGAPADVTDTTTMDAAVQTLTAAGIATTLGTTTTNPPSASDLARHNTNLKVVQTRPNNSRKGCLLMATLKNTSGGGLAKLLINYTSATYNTVTEQVPGLRVYYSLTGAAGSWTVIPALSNAATGPLSAGVELTSTWAADATMYVLWVDDDSSNTDGSWTLDNVSFEEWTPAADILAFNWQGFTGEIDELANPNPTIKLRVPTGTPLNPLNPNPSFTLSAGATCNKNSGGTGEYNFSSAQTYTVTASGGSPVKSYDVSVTADIPTVTLGLTGSPLVEAGGVAVVTATIPAATDVDVIVNLAFSGSAALGPDYTAATSIVIPAGDTSATIDLTAIADGVYEAANETITVDVSTVVNGIETGTQQVSATITDGDTQPTNLPSPGGINPVTSLPWTIGDTYHLVFVTSTATAATNPNISFYNAFVNTAAAGSTLPGISNVAWKAIGTALNNTATPAKVNAPVTAPVYLVDQATKVANSYADMWDGSIANPINKNESGIAVDPAIRAWTGTNNSGDSNRPLGKTDGYVQYGLTSSATSTWINANEQPGGTNRMYALSIPLTVTTAAPTALVSLGVSPAGSLAEAAGEATLTATLSETTTKIVTVNLKFSGTATRGTDYTCDTSIVIPAGELTGSVTLAAVQDARYEGPDETIVIDIDLALNALENGTQQVSTTIDDDDPQPTGLPVPTGINPTTGNPWAQGDLYQLVFVTSTATAATNPNISYYNDFVNTAAAGSTLPGIPSIVWKAIGTALNDPATPANVNAPVSAPVYLIDGTAKVANGYSDMWDGTIASPINKNESSVAVDASVRAWTGTNNSGGSNRPLGKTDNYVQYGLASSTTSTWINANEQNGGTNRIYALSIPLTYSELPPTALVTLGSAPAGPLAEDGGAATLTATLSETSTKNVSVNLAFSGTAKRGPDYTCDPSIVITAGQLTGSVTLTAVQDALYEGANETIAVDIDSVANALEDGTQQVSTTILDDDGHPVIAAPTGINPATGILWQTGDKYHLAFVTSTSTAATNPSIAYYNTFVNTAAAGSTLPGVPSIVWSVIGSALNDPAAPAKVNATVGAPVYLVDGSTKVADGSTDMWNGSIANPINLDESGNAVAAGTKAWTGSNTLGDSYRPFGKLDNWVQYGSTGLATGGWLSDGEQNGGTNRLYALSIPLTHPGGVAAVAPLAPTITVITAHDGSLSVAFTAGYDGGAAITNYKYSTDDGGTWTAVAPAATTSPILISGLTNGTTYQVKILAVNSVGDGAPSAAVSGTPAAGTSYAAWAAANGASSDPLADSNHNGVSNGVEFFMGGTLANPATLPPVVNTAGTWSWTIPYDPAALATYKFQVSDDLAAWQDVLPGDPSITVLTSPDRIQLTLAGPAAKKFCRLLVTTP
jgi:hypothetical protein